MSATPKKDGDFGVFVGFPTGILLGNHTGTFAITPSNGHSRVRSWKPPWRMINPWLESNLMVENRGLKVAELINDLYVL